MPIYSWKCAECGFLREELRKMGDLESPTCINCNIIMDRLFTPPIVIVGGPEATQAKLKKRSDEQGKRFFSRAAYALKNR